MRCPSVRGAACALAVTLATSALGGRALAQPVEPNDTTRATIRPAPLMEGMLLMPIAPGAAAFLLKREPGPQLAPLGYWDKRVSAHVAGGPAFADTSGETSAYSAGVEVLVRGWYAEVRNEHFRLPEHIEYRSARLGYLIHPVPEVAGGVTVGYREARGVRGHSGAELAFPFVAGSRTWWLRYEAAYVMGKEMVSWSYRMQAEFLFRGGPLYWGLNVEAKSLPLSIGSKVMAVPVALLVGVRR